MTEQDWLASNEPQAMLRYLTYEAHVAPDAVGDHLRERALVSDRKLRLFGCACAWVLAREANNFHRLSQGERRTFIAAVEAHADGESGLPGHPYDSASYLLNPNAARVARHAAELSVPCGYEFAPIFREIVGNPFRPVTLPPAEHLRFDGIEVRSTPILSRHRYATPTVLSLAQAAYEERPGRACEQCGGAGQVVWASDEGGSPLLTCNDCHGTGRIADGTLDPFRLALLADALEEAGCPAKEERPCPLEFCKGGYWKHSGDPNTYPHKCHVCENGRVRVPSPLLSHLRSPGPHVRGCWATDLVLGKS